MKPDPDTRTALLDHAAVVVNYRTGTTVVLTGDTLALWLAALPASGAPAPVTVPDSDPSWGTVETPVRLEPLDAPPWRWRLPALACLLATLLSREIGPASTRFVRLLRLAEAGRALPAADSASARLAVRSVRWGARWIPARVACLEESTAASLLLALTGRGRAWRHGVATDPVRLHAWICDNLGQPVEEPSHTGQYTVLNGSDRLGAKIR
ncbi:hypothetical protein P3T37_002230 [Kitasatospora sp. MAA4]|uniref:lasso peptide biosynthesis B2 protein n=1 Tax=Kitasatospora sp. MAA4 TaxID=3035093 RepID=UPI002474DC3D|nr:lasso peptide biosynthesis B2 protein [Kitasatospora sp. MAA4]MDH6132844.1 hypothetical protein [Kitasatospora sp. MAA4]